MYMYVYVVTSVLATSSVKEGSRNLFNWKLPH